METDDHGQHQLTGPLYQSPRGLYDFQAQLTAYCCLRRANLPVVDTGLGKTHIALATAAVLLEDNEIDYVLVVVEGNKDDEWMDDFARFTRIPAVKYAGSPERRRKLLAGLPARCALVATYHTAANDLCVTTKDKRNAWKVEPNFMIEHFRGKRMLIIWDEMTVLGNYSNAVHKAHKLAAHTWDARMLGLTATPVTNGQESYYGLGRILCPAAVGTLAEFERDHVLRRDKFHRIVAYKPGSAELLAQKMSGVLLRKRKTDPDVRDQFPTTVEDFVSVRLAPEHAALYDELHDLFEARNEDGGFAPGFKVLQGFANHPRSILTSVSPVVDEFMLKHTVPEIEALVCTKSDLVVRQVRSIVNQDDQVIVFCAHTSVLRALADDLARASIPARLYLGTSSMSKPDREASKASFKEGITRVLLMSGTGERGINLPEASYVINYDVPLLHSSYLQRLNRGSRIGSNAGGELIVKTYMATGTVEDGSVRSWNNRNKLSDTLIDRDVDEEQDDAFVSAQARLAMVRAARTKENHAA